jgi:peptidyl-tRNA hydrolase, PTH1 family
MPETAPPEVETGIRADAERAAEPLVVVGLGNPGAQYANTPHNLGFLAAERLAERNKIRITTKAGAALTGTGKISGRDIIVAKPQTFMNRSGASVKPLLQMRRLTARNLILVYDDLALPWTALRIKTQGSAAGHNGVKSVIAELGTDRFMRVRLGIYPSSPVEDAARYVLAPFERAWKQELDEMLTYAAEAIESIIANGAIKAMTSFNRRAQGLNEEEE